MRTNKYLAYDLYETLQRFMEALWEDYDKEILDGVFNAEHPFDHVLDENNDLNLEEDDIPF